MSQPILLKVYGNIWPAGSELAKKLEKILGECLPEPAVLVLTGNLLTISFEGLYFPVEETVQCLQAMIGKESQGKLDVLDLENWRLTRYRIAKGKLAQSSAPLNNVLDYSGH